MSEHAAATVSLGIPDKPTLSERKEINNLTEHLVNGANPYAHDVLAKYQHERDKRLRADGMDQYIDPSTSEKLKQFQSDPWVTPDTPNPGLDKVKNGDRFKVLIVGAGFGGMLFAARLLGAGVDDFVLVDTAGGFGGTWYWNRYPGLMCDVESYVYLPLLEEMEYVPKQKYSTGYELRTYAQSIADKYQLDSKAILQVKVHRQTWIEDRGEWEVELHRVNQQGYEPLKIYAEVVISSTGILNLPKMANLPGLSNFAGKSFHTSRWDYQYTGGSQESPDMANLSNKRVGIIGTGATAVQAVPQLAKWAKELYVFQRTPSAVDVRNNKETNIEWFNREVRGSGKGWQRRRAENFNSWVSDSPISEDMVADAWTKMRTFSILVGKPEPVIDIPAYIAERQATDLMRQERIRERVDDIVNDKQTAEKLKPWYSGWCKRPTFHDEYLPSFNLNNVHLIDTNGRGVERISTAGPVVGGIEYPVDVLIFSTGFYTPAGDSPAARSNSEIYGRGGASLDSQWKEKVSTLHGIITSNFPNLLFPGPHQSGASANAVYALDWLSEHIVYLLSEAQKASRDGKIYIEPEVDATEQWATEVLSRAGNYAALAGCTPGYLNAEGAADRPKSQEEMLKGARAALWGTGIADYTNKLEEWKADHKFKGLLFSPPTVVAR